MAVLDGWEGPLTWDLLIDAIESQVGGRYARQTLDRHDPIKLAYQRTKDKASGEVGQSNQMTAKEMRRRVEDYDRLKAEIARLERENNNYAQQCARWVWNLRALKITENQLSRLDNDFPESLRS